MAVQFGAEILDAYFAPGISAFDSANIPDLVGTCPQSEHWLGNLFLNSIFGSRYTDNWRQAAISFIYRTQTALSAYERARTKTLACVQGFRPGRPATKSYFEALAEWETVVFNIQIVIDLYRRFIAPGESETSEAQQIRLSVNRIKHYAEDLQQGINPADLTVPMWLTLDGIKTSAAAVTYQEIADNLLEMGKAADILQDPDYTQPAFPISPP